MDERARIGENFQEQARLLDLIFKHTPDSIVLMDKDFNFIRVSESYAHSCQKDSSEFPGRNHFEMYPSPLEEEVAPYVKARRIYKRNCRPFVFPDHPEWGTTYWDNELVPILGFNGEVELLLLTLKDVTAQKRTELERQQSEARLAGFIDNSTAIIYMKDVTGKYLLVNKQYENVSRISKKEIIGKTDYDFFPTEVAEMYRVNNQKVIENKVPLEFNETAQLDDGLHHYLAVKFPLIDSTGEVYAVCGISTDITDLMSREEDYMKMEKLESLGLLAGGIAHDFNNILTAIIGNISLAKSFVESRDQLLRRLNEAERASLRASELAQQLLTFSKGGAPIKNTVSIQNLIDHSVKFCLIGSNVQSQLFFQEGLWPVEVDEGQMNQVIQNLVINAKQAMPNGGTIRIDVINLAIEDKIGQDMSLRKGDYLLISIQDEGTGIPKEHLSKIFDPYFTTKPNGSGLGLSITHSIIKRHKGYITAESNPRGGTTFLIFLPASPNASLPQETIGTEAMTRGKGRILVMDDEESVLNIAKETLTHLGYKVDLVKNGSEAVRAFKGAKDSGRPFDAVITDLTVPGGIGGLETLQMLRKIDPQIKVIISSGYSNDPAMGDFKNFGFSDCLKKPYRAFQLSQAVKRVLKA